MGKIAVAVVPGDGIGPEVVRAARRVLEAAGARHAIDLLAVLSHHCHFSVGCYCEDETRCHRCVLRVLLADAGAQMR